MAVLRAHDQRRDKIRFQNFSKSFGELQVLHNLNFTVKENEFLGIVGPTGCGKTTLANLLCGLLQPTAGSLQIDGAPASPRRHNLAFVFQESSCLPWRTVWENITLGLEAKGAWSRDQEVKVREMVRLLGLQGFENAYPGQISGGMRQRVAIARAFVTPCDLLVMDEPFGQNDEKTRFHLENLLLRVWEQHPRTVIFVTHNLEEAVYLSERIMVFSQKPTTVKAEVHVDLPRPRDITDPKFVTLRKHVTELVKWW